MTMPSSVTLPPGIVPVRSLTTGGILTGNRSTSVRYDLVSRTEALKGPLDGVESGSLNWVANASVKGGGTLTVTDVGQAVDWLSDRVRPVMLIDGLPEQPLGVFLAAGAPKACGDVGTTWTVELLDKLTVLDQDEVETTYALPAGTVITDAVATLIASTGETNMAITPSTATLPSAIVWEPTTSKLTIINNLLDVAGYFSLYCDGNGQYHAERYMRPAERPIAWEFLDGDESIYDPNFTQGADLFGIPNKFTAVSQSSGSTPALTSTATNTNPDSPYSYQKRGWKSKKETGVEAADQAALDVYARRRLIELTSPTSSIDIKHAYLPGLMANHAVRFRNTPVGVDARHVVSKTTVSLDPTALATSTFTQVIDL